MLTQTTQVICENIVKQDENSVFCGRVDRWINAVYCHTKCSPERKQREEYEW